MTLSIYSVSNLHCSSAYALKMKSSNTKSFLNGGFPYLLWKLKTLIEKAKTKANRTVNPTTAVAT